MEAHSVQELSLSKISVDTMSVAMGYRSTLCGISRPMACRCFYTVEKE